MVAILGNKRKSRIQQGFGDCVTQMAQRRRLDSDIRYDFQVNIFRHPLYQTMRPA